ncbi:hypothetical protein G6F46_014738 [Rhizopus delemar]|nr:hypothetical protein G6F46_014738 [Rhizopus delemar]
MPLRPQSGQRRFQRGSVLVGVHRIVLRSGSQFVAALRIACHLAQQHHLLFRQRHALGQRRQHGGQHHGQGLEACQRTRADVLQRGLLRVVRRGDALGQHPRLGRVERLIDAVGVGHDFADGAVVFAGFERGADGFGLPGRRRSAS